MRLNEPSFSRAGPVRISSSVPFWIVLTRAPRGSDGWKVAMPQWNPWPGASWARASGEPIMTASAPQAMAFDTSPPVRIPPSAMTWTYSPVSSMCVERAAAPPARGGARGPPPPGGGGGGARRDAQPEDAASRAGGPGAHAHEHAGRAGAHEVQAGVVAG